MCFFKKSEKVHKLSLFYLGTKKKMDDKKQRNSSPTNVHLKVCLTFLYSEGLDS